MKIVLREHVENLGDRGDIVSVAHGYARNYLLPKHLAYVATPGNMLMLEHQKRVWNAREAKVFGEAEALAQRISGLRLSIARKCGDTGTLYGSVTTSEVAALLLERGVEIDRRKLNLARPIKSVGTHELTIKLHRSVTAVVNLEVLGDRVVSESIEEPPEADGEFEE